jgi:hypothetical protein
MRVSKKILVFAIVVMVVFSFLQDVYALSIRHHLFNTGKNLVKMVVSPFKGVLVAGPKNIKRAYTYEVYEREKVEQREKFRYKVFGVWRAPGEEIKGTVSGVVDTVKYGGEAIKEFTSIFFSD